MSEIDIRKTAYDILMDTRPGLVLTLETLVDAGAPTSDVENTIIHSTDGSALVRGVILSALEYIKEQRNA